MEENKLQPLTIPEKILENAEAIDLYKLGILFVGVTLIAIVIGATILSAMKINIPDMLGNIGVLLSGALVSLIAGERKANNV